MSVQIDTSGVVLTVAGSETAFNHVTWDRLTPFQQGFVEAALVDLWRAERPDPERRPYKEVIAHRMWVPGFSDLAPETLARFMEDCERHEKRYGVARNDPRQPSRGKNFWINRQVGMWASEGFPPLHLYLAEDGKVRIEAAKLAEASR